METMVRGMGVRVRRGRVEWGIQGQFTGVETMLSMAGGTGA